MTRTRLVPKSNPKTTTAVTTFLMVASTLTGIKKKKKKLERPGLQALEKERRSKTEHKTSTTVEIDLESSNDLVSDIHVKSFTAGNMSKFVANWRLMTSDSTILEMVTGYRIAFDSEPFQTVAPHIPFSRGEEEIIETEIS